MQGNRTSQSRIAIGLIAVFCGSLAGCSSFDLLTRSAVPVHRLPPEILGRPRNDMQEISISRLRQDPPLVYQLAAGDVLGVYIEEVLGVPEEAPPVHFPEKGDQPPALGFPVPIGEDGKLSLPQIPPIDVNGLTLAQATEAIKKSYADAGILTGDKTKTLVTLIRRRMYQVIVIRDDHTRGKDGVVVHASMEKDKMTVDLPAYENDVLHALNETGGLPLEDAMNEIYILRGSFRDGQNRDALVSMINQMRQPCQCPPPIPDDPNIVRIPIRFYPEQLPTFTEQDIILNKGDVIYIPGRDREKFYTGGVMKGDQHDLPRDYDLDVLGAVALGGGQVGSGGTGVGQMGGGGGRGGSAGQTLGKNPSELIVIRKLPCGGQIPIKVDLNRAIVDSSQRILVQPEDSLILRYTLEEEIYNALLNLVQFQFLFNGFNGAF